MRIILLPHDLLDRRHRRAWHCPRGVRRGAGLPTTVDIGMSLVNLAVGGRYRRGGATQRAAVRQITRPSTWCVAGARPTPEQSMDTPPLAPSRFASSCCSPRLAVELDEIENLPR